MHMSYVHAHLLRIDAMVIQLLGIPVFACDAAKAKQNNIFLEKAKEAGLPRPPGEPASPTAAATEGASEPPPPPSVGPRGRRRRPGSLSAEARRTRASQFPGVIDAVGGTMYLGNWRRRSRSSPPGWYAVLVLTLGSFRRLGISGHIADTGLLSNFPTCYISAPDNDDNNDDNDSPNRLQWKAGYEDGGPQIYERKFPVM